jgi:hypothetical protein
MHIQTGADKSSHIHPLEDTPPSPSIGTIVGFLGNVAVTSAGTLFCRLGCFILRLTAKAVSIFGQKGQNASKSLKLQARKIKVIHVSHRIYDLLHCMPTKFNLIPLLSKTRNVGTRDSVLNGEDLAKAKVFHDALIKNVANPVVAKKLKEIKLKGAITKGVCFSASLWFIKSVLTAKIDSQEALQKMANECKDGFCSEVSGLQANCLKGSKVFLQMYAEDLKRQGLAASDIEKRTKKFAVDVMQQDSFMKSTGGFRESFSSIFFGLKIASSENSNFLNLETDEFERSQFDELPQGAYSLSFHTALGPHVVTYLKFDFGTYLLDPNFGLMKCEEKPSKTLVKLLEARYSLKDPASRLLHAVSYTLKESGS